MVRKKWDFDLSVPLPEALMDHYWRDYADTLEEPFRSQLLEALDLFVASRNQIFSALALSSPTETAFNHQGEKITRMDQPD